MTKIPYLYRQLEKLCSGGEGFVRPATMFVAGCSMGFLAKGLTMAKKVSAKSVEMVSVPREEYDRLTAGKATGGVASAADGTFSEPEPDSDYNQYERVRVLVGGGIARWTVSNGGWVHLQIDFVPQKGRGARAGFGGYFGRWRDRYLPYFRGKMLTDDLDACRLNGAIESPTAKR